MLGWGRNPANERTKMKTYPTTRKTETRRPAQRCSLCGSTDAEDLQGEDGYTSCCNEPIDWS